MKQLHTLTMCLLLTTAFSSVIQATETSFAYEAPEPSYTDDDQKASLFLYSARALIGAAFIDRAIRREHSVLASMGRFLHGQLGLKKLHTTFWLKKIDCVLTPGQWFMGRPSRVTQKTIRVISHLALGGMGIIALLSPSFSKGEEEKTVEGLSLLLLAHTTLVHIYDSDEGERGGDNSYLYAEE